MQSAGGKIRLNFRLHHIHLLTGTRCLRPRTTWTRFARHGLILTRRSFTGTLADGAGAYRVFCQSSSSLSSLPFARPWTKFNKIKMKKEREGREHTTRTPRPRNLILNCFPVTRAVEGVFFAAGAFGLCRAGAGAVCGGFAAGCVGVDHFFFYFVPSVYLVGLIALDYVCIRCFVLCFRSVEIVCSKVCR